MKNIAIIIFLNIIVSACSNDSNEIIIDNIRFETVKDYKIDNISTVSYFFITENDIMIIGDYDYPVTIYSRKGNDVEFLGKYGKGENEFSRELVARRIKDIVQIYDKALMRVTVVNLKDKSFIVKLKKQNFYYFENINSSTYVNINFDQNNLVTFISNNKEIKISYENLPELINAKKNPLSKQGYLFYDSDSNLIWVFHLVDMIISISPDGKFNWKYFNDKTQLPDYNGTGNHEFESPPINIFPDYYGMAVTDNNFIYTTYRGRTYTRTEAKGIYDKLKIIEKKTRKSYVFNMNINMRSIDIDEENKVLYILDDNGEIKSLKVMTLLSNYGIKQNKKVK